MLDTAGNVVSWNPGAERIKGYSSAEILGHHFSRFYTEDDRQKGLPEPPSQQRSGPENTKRRVGAAVRTEPPLWLMS